MRLPSIFAPKPARLLALLALLAGLAGCGKTPGPVRLDFVGAANLTSSDRTVGAADTVAVRLFAESTNPDRPLTRFRIAVTATPLRRPFVYPAVLSNFRPEDLPASAEQVLLDSTLPAGTRKFAFRTTLTARATTGTERWMFSASDGQDNTATRAFRLTVRRPDSTALVQAYALLARPGRGPDARPYLALDSGQLLPCYAGRRLAPVIDAVVTETAAGVRLAPHTGPATQLRLTARDDAAFRAPATAAAFHAAFAAAPAPAGGPGAPTAPLAKGNVVAYRTADGRYGLLQVTDLVRTPVTTVRLSVRTAK